jgi:hydroxymethylpyrimidine/phosphomethylpyrimidine kinase
MISSARVLVVAGSDSGAGAGIQGDIKTILACGAYATTAITALTAQNTLSVSTVHAPPAAFVEAQMQAILEDIGADIVKTGMLWSAGIIRVVAKKLQEFPQIKLVLDPVMISTSGSMLLKPRACKDLRELLFPRAYVVTPNIPEAEFLSKIKITGRATMKMAAEKILTFGPEAVFLKGGHSDADVIDNLLLRKNAAEKWFSVPRIFSKNTHGTGCACASAIAAFLARGDELELAIERALKYVSAAIANAPQLGKGHGPLGHLVLDV